MSEIERQIIEREETSKIVEPDLPNSKDFFERRKVPRINLTLPVTLQPSGNFAKIVNLSEDGVCIISRSPFPNIISVIKVKLPKEVVETQVKPIWVFYNKTTNKYVARMQFSSLAEEDILKLRQALFRYQIRKLLKRSKDYSKLRSVNDFFLEKVLAFATRLISLQKESCFETGYSLRTQEEISKLSDELVSEGNRIEEKIDDKLLIRQLKENFRHILGHWAFQSNVMRRGFEKPMGYPGDYYLLELIYTNRLVSKAPMGAYFDGYFLNNPYATGVRNRKDAMERILWRNLVTAERPYSLLNIACGSCREIRNICLDPALNLKTKITFSCFDQDQEALDYSKQSLAHLPSHLRSKIQFKFLSGDVMDFSKNPQHFKNLFCNPDVIYSIGLADYLPDRVLRNVLKFCYEILAPSGKLIVAFKDKGQDEFAPIPPDWFCNWKFIPRTSENIRSLISSCKLTSSKLSLEWEWSKKIVFTTLKKE